MTGYNIITTMGEATPGDSIVVGYFNNRDHHAVCSVMVATETFEAIAIDKTFIGLVQPYRKVGWLAQHHASHNSAFELYGCAYGWRVNSKLVVGLVYSKIITPNQVCCLCKLPAPHSKPNKDSEFICSSCKFLEELK